MENHKHSEQGFQQQRFQAAQKCTWISFVVNFVLSLLQIVIGWLVHSQALIADGLHSFSDLLSDVLVLYVNRRSHQSADAQHPYGHARIETAATLFLGTSLLLLGLGLLLAAGWSMQHGGPSATQGWLALSIAFITLVAKELLFRYLLAVAKRVRSPLLVANAWHSRSDAASSLVVLVGVAGSWMGFPWLDLLAAAVVAGMIMRMGGQLMWQSIEELIDTGLDPQQLTEITQTLLHVPGVTGVHALRSRKMAEDALLDVHIEVDPRISVSEGHYIAEAAEQAVLSHHHVRSVMVHIDPQPEDLSESKTPFPSRQQLQQQLQPLFPMLDWNRLRWQLHYLPHGIEVELYLPLELLSDQTNITQACELAQVQIPQLATIAPMWCGSNTQSTKMVRK